MPSVYCLMKRLQRDSSPAFRAEAESSHHILTTPPAVPSSARELRPEPGKGRTCPSRTSLLLIFSSKNTNEQVLAEDLPGARRCGVTTSSPRLPSEGFSSETKRPEPGQDQLLGVMSAEGGTVCSICRWLRDPFTFLLDLGAKFQTIDCGKNRILTQLLSASGNS